MAGAPKGRPTYRWLAGGFTFFCVGLLAFAFFMSLQLERRLRQVSAESAEKAEAASNLLWVLKPAEIKAAKTKRMATDSRRQAAYRQKTLYDLSLLSLEFALSEDGRLGPALLDRPLLLLDPSSGQILAKQGLAEFHESTLSQSRPALLAAIQKGVEKSARRGFWLIQDQQEWALGPALPKGHRILLRPPAQALLADQPISGAISVARTNALVELARSSVPQEVSISITYLRWFRYGFLALVTTVWLLAMRLFRTQFAQPLEQINDSARAWLDGDSDAHARVDYGVSEARQLARTINAIIEHADTQKHGRLRVIADGSEALASSLSLVAKGDLKVCPPTVPPELKPIALAMEEMVDGLSERIAQLYDHALKVAVEANAVNYGSARIKQAFTMQLASLQSINEAAIAAAEAIKNAPLLVQEDCQKMATVLDEQRSAAQRLRIKIAAVSRRSSDLGDSAQRLKQGMIEAGILDEALDVLSCFGDDELATEAREAQAVKAGALARTSRQALAGLKQLAASLAQDMESVRSGINGLNLSVLPQEDESPSALSGALHRTVLEFAQIAESMMQALSTVEANASSMQLGAEEWMGERSSGNNTIFELDRALCSFDLDGRLDEGLLNRLKGLREKYAALQKGGELTPDAVAMISQIKIAAQESKQRLTKMIDSVEATAESLRDTQT